MKYVTLLGNPKSFVLLVHSLLGPSWVDASERGPMRLLEEMLKAAVT
jgi:hypothetical protein